MTPDAMSPEAVSDFVRARLAGQAGPPPDQAHGEPLWAVLEQGFRGWRMRPDLLEAFNTSLANVLQTAIAQKQHDLLRQACELASGVAALHDGWDLPLSAALVNDLQGIALAGPTNDEAEEPSPSLGTQLAALDMLAALDQLPGPALELAFERAMDAPSPERRRRVLALGKALLGAQRQQPQLIPERLWEGVFRRFWHRDAGADQELVKELLFWARVVASDPGLRGQAAQQARRAANTVDCSGLANWGYLDHIIVKRFDGVVFAKTRSPASNQDLRDPRFVARRTQNRDVPIVRPVQDAR